MQVGFVVSAGFLRRHFQVKSSTPGSSLTPRSSDKPHFCCTTEETGATTVAVRLVMSVLQFIPQWCDTTSTKLNC